MQRKILIVLLIMAMLVPMGCGETATATPVEESATSTVIPATATTQPTSSANVPLVIDQPEPTLVPTPAYSLVGGLPANIVEAISDSVSAALAPEQDTASIAINLTGDMLIGQYVYVPVAAFPTLTDSITAESLLAFWAGDAAALNDLGEGQTVTLYLTQDTLDALILILGEPAESTDIEIVGADALIDTLWDERPTALGIVGFDELDSQLKVLYLDEQNPLDRELDLDAYPLVLNLYASGSEDDLAVWGNTQVTNRDLEKMTTLVMTGVTALVRATANAMEAKGILYPALYISDTLASADITHISNEIPFAENCPVPDPNQDDVVFCSDPDYIELLRAVGVDIIELTGNHFQDYGDEATLLTIAMYDEEGWAYYGGGKNLEDAQEPAIMENHGNTLSFLGCNPVGPYYAFATEDQPGCLGCDWDYMEQEINILAETVDVPIVTFQYWEFYHYEPTAEQQSDFRAMVDAGAEIVSGSQAHHPQAIEFYNGSFIHYGLGNLFFDQMWSTETRQIMVDRHTIYDGKHISTELLTYTLEDYCQPRPTTDEERISLLTSIFDTSGWMGNAATVLVPAATATPTLTGMTEEATIEATVGATAEATVEPTTSPGTF